MDDLQPKIQHFIDLIIANSLEELKDHGFKETFKRDKVIAKNRLKYVFIERADSPFVVIEKESGKIYDVKHLTYLDRKKPYGSLDTIKLFWWGKHKPELSERNKEI